jgi:hypothetical protein
MKKEVQKEKSKSQFLPEQETSQMTHHSKSEIASNEKVQIHSPDDVKRRILAERKREPWRPLAALAAAETALKQQSSAIATLAEPKKKRPDPNLLAYQLKSTVNTSRVPRTMVPMLLQETVALCRAVETGDPIGSVLARVFVATNNSVMAAYDRATWTGNPQALEINLRHAERGGKLLIALAEALTNCGRSKNITVGSVKVETGGQAFVGTVETKKRAEGED